MSSFDVKKYELLIETTTNWICASKEYGRDLMALTYFVLPYCIQIIKAFKNVSHSIQQTGHIVEQSKQIFIYKTIENVKDF